MHHTVAIFFLFFFLFHFTSEKRRSIYLQKEKFQFTSEKRFHLSRKREVSVYLGEEVSVYLGKRGSIYLGKERFRFNSERRFCQIILMTELENRAYAVPPGRRCLFPHTIGVFHLLIPLPLLHIGMVRPRVQRMIGN